MNLHRTAAAWLAMFAIALLTACASLGVPPADTFAKRLAAGYSTAATVSEGAAALLRAKQITPQDAQRIHDNVDTSLAGLDAAALIAKHDLSAADTRLTAAITVLTALQAYLATKQGAPK